MSWKSRAADILGEVTSNALSHLATTLIDRMFHSDEEVEEVEEDVAEDESEGA